MSGRGVDLVLLCLGGLCVIIYLALVFRRFPVTGVLAVLTVNVLFTYNAVPATQLGNLRLSLTDLVTLALATATAISWRSTRKLDRSALALLALLLLAALRGLSDFDVSTVGNSSRQIGRAHV